MTPCPDPPEKNYITSVMEFLDWEGERKWAEHSAFDVEYRERKVRGPGLLKNYKAEGDVFTTLSRAYSTAFSCALMRYISDRD